MHTLKLIALDQEDLTVLSAHLQDAVMRVGDMTFLKDEKRFAALLNRFDWTAAESEKAFSRMRSGLRFERVLRAQHSGIDTNDGEKVLSLLTVTFEAEDEPSGHVTLLFSGGGAIRLHVECIEAELKDLGAAWSTKHKPLHPDDKGAAN